MPDIDPNMATDLSESQAAADLSKDAIAKREYERKLSRVAGKARAMNRAFKGIQGGRRRHIENAARAEGLIE
jgi:hypothetical protein